MITDYPTLQAAITDYLARDDLSAAVTTFIGMGEARIYRELRTRDMEKTASATITGSSFAVPADYMEMRNLYVTDSAGNYLYELERATPFWIRSTYQQQSGQGTPGFYAREAGNFIVGPYPDGSYPVTLLYYARLPALSGTNTTNWLTNSNPDLIFAASMVEAATYQQDDQAVAYWDSRYQQIARAVERADKRERSSGGPGVMRSA